MRDKMISKMENNKVKSKLDSEALERIKKRESEFIEKKTEALTKQKMNLDRATRFEMGLLAAKESGKAAELKSKVESKVLVETQAMQEKKRDKYDPKKDGPGRVAHTMGGNLLGHQMR